MNKPWPLVSTHLRWEISKLNRRTGCWHFDAGYNPHIVEYTLRHSSLYRPQDAAGDSLTLVSHSSDFNTLKYFFGPFDDHRNHDFHGEFWCTVFFCDPAVSVHYDMPVRTQWKSRTTTNEPFRVAQNSAETLSSINLNRFDRECIYFK